MSGDGSPARPSAQRVEGRGASTRQRVIEAMERRAANLQGAAKQDVLARLSALAAAAPSPVDSAADRAAAPASQGSLRMLLEHIATHSRTSDGGPDTEPLAIPRPNVPPMDVLGEAKQLWSRLRSESQAREALAAEPTGAGPLNSAQLVHRALKLMRDTSPEYLRHFLSYADALSWLAEIVPDPGKAPAAPVRSRARSKPKQTRQRS